MKQHQNCIKTAPKLHHTFFCFFVVFCFLILNYNHFMTDKNEFFVGSISFKTFNGSVLTL